MTQMDLLPHNKSAYDAVCSHLEHSPRTCVVHPTGTGKSYIALQLIEDNPDARILYITSVATNLLEFWDKVEKLGSYRMVLNLSDIPSHIGTGKRRFISLLRMIYCVICGIRKPDSCKS